MVELVLRVAIIDGQITVRPVAAVAARLARHDLVVRASVGRRMGHWMDWVAATSSSLLLECRSSLPLITPSLFSAV